MTTPDSPTVLPAAWNVLHQALAARRAVRARYHNHLRVICPHALGWKNGRPKALVYQVAIIGHEPSRDPRGWRSLYVDEIEQPTLTADQWHTATNYTPHTTGIDTLAVAIT